MCFGLAGLLLIVVWLFLWVWLGLVFGFPSGCVVNLLLSGIFAVGTAVFRRDFGIALVVVFAGCCCSSGFWVVWLGCFVGVCDFGFWVGDLRNSAGISGLLGLYLVCRFLLDSFVGFCVSG